MKTENRFYTQIDVRTPGNKYHLRLATPTNPRGWHVATYNPVFIAQSGGPEFTGAICYELNNGENNRRLLKKAARAISKVDGNSDEHAKLIDELLVAAEGQM